MPLEWGDPVKVIRFGRHEYTQHEATADGEIHAGDIVVEQNGGETVTRADGTVTQEDQWGIAIDDRERGMELKDTYVDGEAAQYVIPSGGAFNLLLDEGETLDPSAEDRLMVSATNDGKLVPYSGTESEDALVVADTDGESVEAQADDTEPIPVRVI